GYLTQNLAHLYLCKETQQDVEKALAHVIVGGRLKALRMSVCWLTSLEFLCPFDETQSDRLVSAHEEEGHQQELQQLDKHKASISHTLLCLDLYSSFNRAWLDKGLLEPL